MGIVGTTHPFSSPRHRRYRRIGWRSRLFFRSWEHPPAKNKTHRGTTHLQQRAPPPVLKGIDGRPHPSIGGNGARTGSFRAGAECAATRAAAALDKLCPTLENSCWCPPAGALSPTTCTTHTRAHTCMCLITPVLLYPPGLSAQGPTKANRGRAWPNGASDSKCLPTGDP